MRAWLVVALAAAALAAAGCGGGADDSGQETTAAMTTTPAMTEGSADDEWARQAVEEILHEYRVDVARHCVDVIGYEVGELADPPTAESFTLMAEAIDGTISIARARPDRTLMSDGATLTIGDWLYRLAETARCDPDAADRLRYTADTL